MAINKINSKSIEDLQISAEDLANGTVTSAKLSYPLTTFSSTGIDDNADSSVVTLTNAEDMIIGTGSDRTSNLSQSSGNLQIKNGIIFESGDVGVNNEIMTYRNNALVFGTSASERMRIDSDGLKFNGDTAAANALDDYEEGTFTPTIEGSSTAGTATYSDQVGKYTKIGNVVTIQIQLGYSGGTGSGSAMYIKGLPFTGANMVQSLAVAYTNNISLPTNRFVRANIGNNHNFIRLFTDETGGGASNDLAYDSAGDIAVGGTYFI